MKYNNFLDNLPEPIKSWAIIEVIKDEDSSVSDPNLKLVNAFIWYDTPQGHRFWDAVGRNMEQGSPIDFDKLISLLSPEYQDDVLKPSYLISESIPIAVNSFKGSKEQFLAEVERVWDKLK